MTWTEREGYSSWELDQPTLDMPELVWKSYIDFEEYEEEYDRARALYERLLKKTDHVKVWINYARFEINVPDPNQPVTNEGRRATSQRRSEAAGSKWCLSVLMMCSSPRR